MEKIKDFLWLLVNPTYWYMNHAYSEEWDYRLNKLLDQNKFSEFNRYTAKLGEFKLWTSNIPYSCMHPYQCMGVYLKVRASRTTIRRAIKRLEIDYIKSIIDKPKKRGGMMILDGNSRVGKAKVYNTELEMKQDKRITELERERELLLEAVEFSHEFIRNAVGKSTLQILRAVEYLGVILNVKEKK